MEKWSSLKPKSPEEPALSHELVPELNDDPQTLIIKQRNTISNAFLETNL